MGLDPNLALAFSLRALVFIAKGEYERAIEDCDVSLRLDAEGSAAYFYRGTALVEKGLPDQALLDLDAAIARPDARRRLPISCHGLAKKGLPGLARSDLDDAIKLDRNSIQSLYHRAWLKIAEGQFRGRD